MRQILTKDKEGIPMKISAVFILFLLTQACVSFPVPLEQVGDPKLGISKSEADNYFSSRNNNTGNWHSLIGGKRLAEKGEETTYRYYWKPNLPYFGGNVATWELIFIEDKLVSYSLITPRLPDQVIIKQGQSRKQNQEMDMLCKDAIARNDRGGIFVHC